jgi:hypothetical protein
MEQRVTTYSEYAMSTSVNGIKDIEAQTLDGISVQKIYFEGVGDRPNCQNRPWDKRVRSAERGRPALRASAGSAAVARGVSDYYDEKHSPRGSRCVGLQLLGLAARLWRSARSSWQQSTSEITRWSRCTPAFTFQRQARRVPGICQCGTVPMRPRIRKWISIQPWKDPHWFNMRSYRTRHKAVAEGTRWSPGRPCADIEAPGSRTPWV